MTKKITYTIIFLALFGVSFFAIQIYYDLGVWTYKGKTTHFEVKPGDTFAAINGRLFRSGLISNPRVFHRYAQFNGLMTKFKVGVFTIKSDSSMMDVFKILIYGQSLALKVTIPEGKNLYEIAQILELQKIIKSSTDFIKEAKASSLSSKFAIPAESLEGYLYPDTYSFPPNTSIVKIQETMVKNFLLKTKNISFDFPNFTPHQLMILASVVEKETGASWERPIIAGVFHNRLKINMRLQSDPTTIYGIYERYRGNITKNDLLEKTDYNTYQISGLPKGPICNPGLASIEAVLTPKPHEFLYFVSQNDGTHIFSVTYKEHLAAVEKFQKSAQYRKGRSWRDLKQN